MRIFSIALILILIQQFSATSFAAQSGFSDVPSDAWFASSVQEAASLGIVSGYRDAYGNPSGRFGPENSVTFAEALKIAIESAGYDIRLGQGSGHWAARYLSIAIGERFELAPNQYVDLDRSATRAEVASLIADAFKAPMMLDTLIPENFTDVDDEDPRHHYEAVNQLLQAGVITGDDRVCIAMVGAVCPKTTFRPLALINRAETVKIAMAARAAYRKRGSSSSSSNASMVPCSPEQCGEYPVGTPVWKCQDGTLGGLSCKKPAGGSCGWVMHQCASASSSFSSSSRSSASSRSSVSSRRSSSRSALPSVTVLYSLSGFSPSVIRVKVGQTVIFKNITEDDDLWVASNPHPTHVGYSGFDQGRGVIKDGEYVFTFTQKGTWGYHNHLNPSRGGQVIVE